MSERSCRKKLKGNGLRNSKYEVAISINSHKVLILLTACEIQLMGYNIKHATWDMRIGSIWKFDLPEFVYENTLIGVAIEFYTRIISTCMKMHTLGIWRALFQNALNAIPEKGACNANAKFKYCILVKSFWHVYIYPYICTYLWRALFQNMIPDVGIGIVTSIFGLVLSAFWKRALHIWIIIDVSNMSGTFHSLHYILYGIKTAESIKSITHVKTKSLI